MEAIMNLAELKTVSDLPYPEVEATKNICDAKLLMNDYAGRDSETTAIMQYMYQYYIVDQFDHEIAHILEEIAVTEMHHHEYLGKAIVKLGGDPIISGLGPFWNGSYVCYARQLKSMLQADIAGEETAIRNYTKTAMCVTEKSVADLIYRIILDEEIHIQVLNQILEYISFWK
jgi:bacterioferritin